MTNIEKILLATNHRSFDYPKERWAFYQEWNRALFLHWKVPVEILRELVPEKLHIDTYEGSAYVSLVAFTMEKIRPRYLPAVSFISDFHEINLRTYVDNDNKKGVYFINIEAQKILSVLLTKYLSGLPYEKAKILRGRNVYKSENSVKGFRLDAAFEPKEIITKKTELQAWLTERYCLYMDKVDSLFCYDIHHKEWALKRVELNKLDLAYETGKLKLTNTPDLMQYSEGVGVVAWQRTKIAP